MFHMTNNDLVNRALAAYFKYPEFPGTVPMQPSRNSSMAVDLDGKTYVVIATSSDVLAVYRLRNDGVLRRMKRPPRQLLEW